jgi:hypothetical protein
MKLFTKPAVLAAGVSLISLAAHAASFAANDLYLGFNQASASSDYLIDLGQASAVGVGGSSVVDLSGLVSLSLINSTFTSPVGVSMGVVGGKSDIPTGTYDLYATALRIGGAGTPGVAGSDLTGFNHSQGTIANAESTLTTVGFPTAGNGLLISSGSSGSWTKNVSPTLSANTFYGASGVDPSSAIDGSGILYEDLWKATPGEYSYMGYFTLDASGSSASLTFTPTAVPEPASGALFCAGTLFLWVCFRRRFSRKKA